MDRLGLLRSLHPSLCFRKPSTLRSRRDFSRFRGFRFNEMHHAWADYFRCTCSFVRTMDRTFFAGNRRMKGESFVFRSREDVRICSTRRRENPFTIHNEYKNYVLPNSIQYNTIQYNNEKCISPYKTDGFSRALPAETVHTPAPAPGRDRPHAGSHLRAGRQPLRFTS